MSSLIQNWRWSNFCNPLLPSIKRLRIFTAKGEFWQIPSLPLTSNSNNPTRPNSATNKPSTSGAKLVTSQAFNNAKTPCATSTKCRATTLLLPHHPSATIHPRYPTGTKSLCPLHLGQRLSVRLINASPGGDGFWWVWRSCWRSRGCSRAEDPRILKESGDLSAPIPHSHPRQLTSIAPQLIFCPRQLTSRPRQLSCIAPQLSNIAPQPSNIAHSSSNIAPQPSNIAHQPTNAAPISTQPPPKASVKPVQSHLSPTLQTFRSFTQGKPRILPIH
jgi:hypothetical protein